MKAAVLEKRGAEGLRVRDFPKPQRQPGEALMRIRAAGVNRVDLYMRDNGVGITHQLPLILGVEGAGEIVEADPDSGLKPGMKAVTYTQFCGRCRYCLAGEQPLCESLRIAGEHRHGFFAEYISLPTRCFIPLPDTTDLVEVAALPSAYLTAWRMLFGKRQLRPDETVLIVGIGSGVAVACLQLARIAGARAIVTSSSDEKIRRALELGASHGINYRTEPVSKSVLALTDGKGVDMVIDSVGEASWGESLRSLRRGGRLVTCGATTGSNPPADLQRVFIRQLEIYGSTGGNLAEFRELIGLYSSGKLRPVIDRRYALDDIDSAFGRLQRGEQFGKLLITIE
ncbi:MAG: zinc-binding dehydrogenase [Sulfuricaulis sp.]|nr:zinc-binding dehydrogenase [Sulfuricaulis sp.]